MHTDTCKRMDARTRRKGELERGAQAPVIAHNEGDHLDLLRREAQQVLAVADDVAGMLVVGGVAHEQPHTAYPCPQQNASASQGPRHHIAEPGVRGQFFYSPPGSTDCTSPDRMPAGMPGQPEPRMGRAGRRCAPVQGDASLQQEAVVGRQGGGGGRHAGPCLQARQQLPRQLR